MIMMKPTFNQLAGLFFGAFFLSSPAFGDTVLLTNGSRIDGKVITDNRARGGEVVLGIGGIGTMMFRAGEVADVKMATGGTTGDSTAAGNFVEVTLAKGSTFYGSGSYFGTISPALSDEKNVVLSIPEVGTITIPRDVIVAITEVSDSSLARVPAALAAEETTGPTEIRTSHAIYLKNGRKLIGTVLDTTVDEPIKVQIGQIGILIMPRDDVARIEEEAGVISVPAATEAEVSPVPEAPAADELDTLKEEIKAEILRELLQELLNVRLGSLEAGAEPYPVVTRTTLTGETAGRVREALRELTRHRTQNRVRAERRLKSMGAPVLPYVQSLVHHPFELTRRAVQRIVRDIGSQGGVPIAIEGLSDEDKFVRELAHEALRKLLPEANAIAYRPSAPRGKLAEAQEEYRATWDEIRFEAAGRAALEQLSLKYR